MEHEFLLTIGSNHGSISHRLRDISTCS